MYRLDHAVAATLKDLLDKRDVRELLFENSRKEKTLKRFLEYCYMIDVKVALEGLNGEKTRGLKAAVKYVKEHDIGMTVEHIRPSIL